MQNRKEFKMTDAERQRRATVRRKNAGMVQVRKWVPAHAKAAVKAAIDKAVKDAAETVERIKGDAQANNRD